MTDLTNQLSNASDDQLKQAAQQADMPNADSANRNEIIEWLAQNKPEVATSLTAKLGL